MICSGDERDIKLTKANSNEYMGQSPNLQKSQHAIIARWVIPSADLPMQ